MSFWENSTDAQKLAQIDGGIDCTMTIRQIAMNCGTTPSRLAYFGRIHGRKFPAVSAGSSHHKRENKRGGSVQQIIAARAAGAPNVHMRDAFEIFGTSSDRQASIFSFAGDGR
jgi:hypothetical protein